MKDLLDKIQEIKLHLNRRPREVVSREQGVDFYDICDIISKITDANAYVISDQGKLLGYAITHDLHSNRVEQMMKDKQFDPKYVVGISALEETTANIELDNDFTVFSLELRDELTEAYTTIFPLYAGGEKLGFLILGRLNKQFNQADIVLGEFAAQVITLELQHEASVLAFEETRRQAEMEMAVGSLSYSELVSIKTIFEQSDEVEFRITASKIAEESDITRSVIVNALRKLESAGIITSRSLGMKGTFIDGHSEENIDRLKKEIEKRL